MVVEKSRTISEVAKSYGLVPQTVGNWVNKWRKTHSGTESEEMTAAQLAEYKKIKAELREARTGDRFLEKSGGLLRAGIPVAAKYVYIPPRGRQLSCVSDVPLGQSVSFRLPQGGGIRVYPRRRNAGKNSLF